MMQPIYPVQGANYALPQQPSYNAVKIDIHNPSVGAPGMAPMQPQYQPQYAPVNAPIYNYPQYPVYCPQPQVPAETTATAHARLCPTTATRKWLRTMPPATTSMSS